MELHHLRCVAAIAEHRTFTEAAAALHVSQPALSHAVARLERELGARLFERSTTQTQLTAAGQAFLAPARKALAEVNTAAAAVAAVAGVVNGELRVAGVRTAVIETARLVAAFHARYPGVTVMMNEPSGDRGVIEAVRGARCDIGVVHTGQEPADLPGTAAGAHEIVAIFPTALAPRAESVTVASLSDMPFVAPLPGTDARVAFDTFFRRHAKRPTLAAECSFDHAIVELVRGGLGVALIADSLIAANDTEGVALRPLRPRVRAELTAIRRPQPSPAAEAFCRMLPPSPKEPPPRA